MSQYRLDSCLIRLKRGGGGEGGMQIMKLLKAVFALIN